MTGSLRQRGPNAWELRVSTGRDPLTGRYRQVTRTVHGTKTAAKRKLGELAEEVAKGRRTGTAATLGLLIERWLDQVSPDLSPTTVTGYRRNIETHIKKSDLWAKPLRKLEPSDLDAFYTDLRRRKGLAVSTVRQVHAVIRRACRQGVIWKWLPSNPASLASPGSADPPEHTPPLPADVLRLIDTAAAGKNPDVAMFIRLAAATGARRGELCALRWRHVDLEGGELRIERSIIELPDRSLMERTTKTKKPRRVRLDPDTVEALRSYRAVREATAAACDVRLGPAAYLFSTEADASTPARPDAMTRAFTRLRDRLGLAGVRLHDARHFHATQLLAAGVPVKTVSARLGHAQTSTTLNIYAHALEAADQDAAAVIGALLEARAPDDKETT